MNRFNKLVGLIFGKLYHEFPVAVELGPEAFLEKKVDERDEKGGFSFPEYFDSTVRWL